MPHAHRPTIVMPELRRPNQKSHYTPCPEREESRNDGCKRAKTDGCGHQVGTDHTQLSSVKPNGMFLQAECCWEKEQRTHSADAKQPSPFVEEGRYNYNNRQPWQMSQSDRRSQFVPLRKSVNSLR
jgi:hypothetical protein